MLYYLLPVITNIVLMLVLTLIIAATTLIERKILSLMQRRVGPQFVGYKGRLQYIADALKMFLKGSLIPDESNKFFFVTMPAIIATICYSFWMNAVWGPSVSIFEIEFNIVYASLFSALFTLAIILTGYFSKNKYAMFGAIRAGIGMLNLELFLGLMFLNIILISESFSFLNIVTYQEIFWLVFLFFILLGLIIITFLLEVNRSPFDLSEAESELVAGYTTEYGGFFFGVYYLGEYLHLYFFSILLATIYLGGWELPNFLYIFFITLYDDFNFVTDTLYDSVFNTSTYKTSYEIYTNVQHPNNQSIGYLNKKSFDDFIGQFIIKNNLHREAIGIKYSNWLDLPINFEKNEIPKEEDPYLEDMVNTYLPKNFYDDNFTYPEKHFYQTFQKSLDSYDSIYDFLKNLAEIKKIMVDAYREDNLFMRDIDSLGNYTGTNPDWAIENKKCLKQLAVSSINYANCHNPSAYLPIYWQFYNALVSIFLGLI